MTTKPAKIKRRAGPGRLSAGDTALINDRLMDAALALFDKHGYEAATMEGIARAAGASTKTVYSRYDNKAAILQAVVLRLMNRVLAQQAATAGNDPTKVELRNFLTEFTRNIALAINANGSGLHRLAYAEGHRFPELQHLYDTIIGRGTGIIRAALEHSQREGRLPFLPALDTAAPLLLSILTDRARIRAVLGTPMSAEEIDAHVTTTADIFLKAAGYRPA